MSNTNKIKWHKHIEKEFIDGHNTLIIRYWKGYINKYGSAYEHNDSGPARFFINTDPGYKGKRRNIVVACWLVNNKLHRADGPAVEYYDNPTHDQKYYWVLGHNVTEKEFYTPGFVDAFILENS
jgi:hypothetical protein